MTNPFKLSKEEQLMTELTETYHKIDTLEKECGVFRRVERSDKGKKRVKYDSSLPLRYRQYLGRANQRGLLFELTVDDFNTIFRGACVYCGSTSKIGVDRVDSSLGYNLENVQPCCGTCNWMKQQARHEDFLRHVDKIYRHCLQRS